ncbi:hypothetical protein JKF63_02098 [Porcisia hertigi]|uniref:Uncharacterized protein n=1 Tax=Porcisia hertigi TaxID=2761500 RepID=A0A836I216_9TRYP|nr:hypothetical protein JKF63_02098 [Porcisia hertigi]
MRHYFVSSALCRHQRTTAKDPHCFLSASEVIRPQAAGARNKLAGLSVTLPPLCAWGACAGSGRTAEGLNPRHGSSNPYNELWAPIESYVARVNAVLSDMGGKGTPGMTLSNSSPPLCLVLRLFPDLTIAQLPALPRRSKEDRHAPRRARNSFIAPHEYPLDAILGAEALWGGGADTQRVFRSAIDALHGLGQHFLPQLPLVLQMPTRLIVSQQFLHDLAALLIRDGWRSVAFELPSTHQLYSHSVEKYGADAAWCQLPLLCTPWASLCRHPRLGQTLRQLRRHDAVPFHVLYSWAVSEMQLFSGLEQSIVVDTTAPMPGEEAMYAYLQSPSSVGQTAEELHCAQPKHTRQLRDVTDAALSPFQAAGHADGTRVAVYMSENPTRTHGVGPGSFNDVVDAVRQGSRSAASREYNRADLDRVYDELRLRRHTDTGLPSAASKGVANSEFVSPDVEGSVSLVLDSPPDYLRALIEKSIVDSDVAVRPAPSERHRLLQKVGEFLQHTMVEPSVSGSGDAASPSSSATCKAHENASLEQEAGELERLLREANETRDATTTGSDVEQMMAEMQQSIRAYTQLSSCDTKDGAEERACHQPSLPHRRGTNGMHNTHAANSATASNAWSTFPGYWSCIHALVQQFTYPTLLWTAPTFNKAAVRAWAAAYHASRYSSGGYDETHMSTRGAPLPLVVPVYMPAQSVMHVEVERLLREGRWFERPPLLRGREEETALHTWLPASLNAALADALSKLPSDYQACERRRLLLDHQRLRREGAHGARRCSTVMEVADTSPTSSAIAGDEPGLDTVRIRIHQETRPLYLLTPAQVQRRESQAFKEAAAMCAASQEAHATLDRGRVRGIHDSFVQAVEESYRAISPASEAPLPQTALPVLFLHVPTPGLDVDELCRSSRCLSA